MSVDRLTIRNSDGSVSQPTTTTIEAVFNRLADYEDAEQEGRLVVLPPDKARWIKAILSERDRQDEKWGFPQENTHSEWGNILGEEFGELSKELNELNFGRGDRARMEQEAVQVAAVALSILEQFDVANMVTAFVANTMGRTLSPEFEAALERMEAAKK